MRKEIKPLSQWASQEESGAKNHYHPEGCDPSNPPRQLNLKHIIIIAQFFIEIH